LPGFGGFGARGEEDLAQKSSSMILALRRKVNIKVRQPLAKIIVPVVSDKVQKQFEKVENLILTETDVKEVEYIHDISV
jgi:isoleucyl-tRNA synthetase